MTCEELEARRTCYQYYLLIMRLTREAVSPVEAVYPEALLARLVEEQVQRLVRSLGVAPELLEVRHELLGQALLRAVQHKSVRTALPAWSLVRGDRLGSARRVQERSFVVLKWCT